MARQVQAEQEKIVTAIAAGAPEQASGA